MREGMARAKVLAHDWRWWLTRPRRERPRCRRAAEQRDELASSDESCHLIPPAGRAAEG
jgi:hypothetical protein